MSESDPYYGRCDSCGQEMRHLGHPLAVVTNAGTVKFRFCRKVCKKAFERRESPSQIPDVGGDSDE